MADIKVKYELCDINPEMVESWKKHFDIYSDRVKWTHSSIFAKEAPAADAIVSPANSFGYMDGGIDLVYSYHFGWQMQNRLQEVIRTSYDGELLVGQAVIIPTISNDEVPETLDWSKHNQGQPIKFLISAPTMRIPLNVADTVNAYLAFRAVILAVRKHNSTPDNNPIHTVLCPGLGTAVGSMPTDKSAYQMLRAFEVFELGKRPKVINPTHLSQPMADHSRMSQAYNRGSELRKEDKL